MADITMRSVSPEGTPWDGLGNCVNPDMTPDEMVERSGMDFSVSMRPAYFKTVDDTFREIPKQYALVRDDNGHVFKVFSHVYKPVQNKQIVNFFREYCEAGDMKLDIVGTAKGGAVVWASASIERDFELPGGDLVTGNVLLATSHDGSLKTRAAITPRRAVCNNMFPGIFGNVNLMWELSHRTEFDDDTIEDAKRTLGLSRERFERFQEVAERLANSPVEIKSREVKDYTMRLMQPDVYEVLGREAVEGAALNNIVDATATGSTETLKRKPISEVALAERLSRTSKNIIDAMIDSPGSKLPSAENTWWGVVNGVSYWTDHQAGRSNDRRFASANFGTRQKLKQNAVELALEYAR